MNTFVGKMLLVSTLALVLAMAGCLVMSVLSRLFSRKRPPPDPPSTP